MSINPYLANGNKSSVIFSEWYPNRVRIIWYWFNNIVNITFPNVIAKSSCICLTLLVLRNAAGPRWTPKSTVVGIFFAAASIDRYPNFTARRVAKAGGMQVRGSSLALARDPLRFLERLKWVSSGNLDAVNDSRFDGSYSLQNFRMRISILLCRIKIRRVFRLNLLFAYESQTYFFTWKVILILRNWRESIEPAQLYPSGIDCESIETPMHCLNNKDSDEWEK